MSKAGRKREHLGVQVVAARNRADKLERITRTLTGEIVCALSPSGNHIPDINLNAHYLSMWSGKCRYCYQAIQGNVESTMQVRDKWRGE